MISETGSSNSLEELMNPRPSQHNGGGVSSTSSPTDDLTLMAKEDNSAADALNLENEDDFLQIKESGGVDKNMAGTSSLDSAIVAMEEDLTQQAASYTPHQYQGNNIDNSSKISVKSLFFCMTFDNPFHEKYIKHPRVEEGEIADNPGGVPKSRMNDELLCTDENVMAEGGVSSTLKRIQESRIAPIKIPNRFQKIIEILWRLEQRGVDVKPTGMLRMVNCPEDVPEDEGGSCNFYSPEGHDNLPEDKIGSQNKGLRLVRKAIYTSPDRDEMNIKVHASKDVMMKFAESRGMIFSSHVYSYGGGRPMIYSKKTDESLGASVTELFMKYPEVANRHYSECGLEGIANKVGVLPGNGGSNKRGGGVVIDSSDNVEPFIPDADIKREKEKRKARQGFIIRNTEKQRILNRLLRDPWQFGGCGIQLDEMIKKKVLIRHFFPLHNAAAMEANGLLQWGMFSSVFQRNPLKQNIENIMDYFGEEVALYSYWMALYTQYLSFLAVAGLACGIAGYISPHKALVSGIFACVCVVWGAGWNVFWNQREAFFVAHYGLDALEDQQTIRDTYESTKEIDITDDKLHLLEFNYPPSLIGTSDGNLVEMHYPTHRRILFRYLVSYPVIILLTGFMVGLQCLITAWRLSSSNGFGVTVGFSLLTLTLSASFDICFAEVIEKLNTMENNRTDNEEEYQTIIKRFFYYFFSKYFALYSILLWPADDLTDEDRLSNVEIQLLSTTLILPFVQNISEVLSPMLKARYRINYDLSESRITAILGTITNKTHRHYPKMTEMGDEEVELWLESQREPLTSMGDDYLEIVLQYGFMSMFAVAFPLAAVSAFLYNIFEIRVDAKKLIKYYQRPYAKPIQSIGAWKIIFGFIAVLAIVSNSFIISVMTPAVSEVGVGELSPERRYQFFVGFQYVLGALAVMVYVLVPSKPENYLKMRVKQTQLANRHALSKADRERKEQEKAAASSKTTTQEKNDLTV